MTGLRSLKDNARDTAFAISSGLVMRTPGAPKLSA
jgi:hypothetical protein